jgi:choline dehydrogenase-like flavoprotein
MFERYDAVVVGGGPTGEHAVGILTDEGKKVALVEREFVGGECSGWACIPTKTLLRPTEVQGEADRVAGVSRPSLDWPTIREYRDYRTVLQRPHVHRAAISSHPAMDLSLLEESEDVRNNPTAYIERFIRARSKALETMIYDAVGVAKPPAENPVTA